MFTYVCRGCHWLTPPVFISTVGMVMAGKLSVKVPSHTSRENTNEKWDLFPAKLVKSISLETT
jgi:hypothetical protein